MRAVDLIIKKKNGLPLTKQEIHFLIEGYVNNSIPDYQMSALLMAICFNGLNKEEQVNLTTEMLKSGEEIDLSSIPGICVDKHSTGGVGDKTTLVVAPLVASCGLNIAKMSGRGLGHTGGTLDKLESIPGFRINVSSEDFFNQVRNIGIAVIGQTANIAPADKKLYALRDVTGTVDSVGLIASSVMSKKLASGAHSILLDVKIGDGAFMKTLPEAQTLARSMVDIGNSFGRKTVAMITNMDEPLGESVGNALEVIEAIETLKGRGPKDFTDLCYELVKEMLLVTGLVKSEAEAKKLILQKITSGEALHKLQEMIQYQGGNVNVINDYSLFPKAQKEIAIYAKKEGFVTKIKALDIGKAAMILGAGREHKEDTIDLAVGIKVLKKVGDQIHKDDVIAIIYSNGKNEEEAYKLVLDSFVVGDSKCLPNQLIYDVVK